jgi:hypothetical protein
MCCENQYYVSMTSHSLNVCKRGVSLRQSTLTYFLLLLIRCCSGLFCLIWLAVLFVERCQNSLKNLLVTLIYYIRFFIRDVLGGWQPPVCLYVLLCLCAARGLRVHVGNVIVVFHRIMRNRMHSLTIMFSSYLEFLSTDKVHTPRDSDIPWCLL